MPPTPDPPGNECSLDQIADEFVARIRDGEHPSVGEYKVRFPEYAADIEELFPTLETLENYDPLEEVRKPTSAAPFDAPFKLGDYFIRREIGRGGMGVVYEAEHESMRRRVALKVLPSNIAKPEYVKRFVREAQSAGQLHHTNIVPVFEVGESGGVHFYTMQYIHGQNLDVVLEELIRFDRTAGSSDLDPLGTRATDSIARSMWGGAAAPTEPYSASPGRVENSLPNDRVEPAHVGVDTTEQSNANSIEKSVDSDSSANQWARIGEQGDNYFRRVAQVGIQIAEALQYAHDHGVLHRDIKPSNLILDFEGTVWITDFGLAKHRGDQVTQSGDVVGTLRYMAPERFKGDADVRSDVYSLGLTLYELCTLRNAFDQSDRAQLVQQIATKSPVSPRRVRPEIPLDLETIIVKAITREPDRRYSSAQQLSSDLKRFLADRPVMARRVTFLEKMYRWARRNPTRAALVTCLALICIMITGGSAYLAELTHQHSMELQAENASVRKAKNKTEIALGETERANRMARSNLYSAYLSEAQTMKSSGIQGQNFHSLRSIRLAVDLVSQLNLNPEKIERRQVELRTASIAAMAQWDVESVHQWRADENGTTEIAIDFRHDRIAQADAQGNIAIRNLGAEEPEFVLPSLGNRAWVTQFSPDGRFLISRYHHAVNPSVPVTCLWNVEEQKEIIRIDRPSLRVVHCFSRDSSMVAIGRRGNWIEVFSTQSGELKYRFRPASLVTQMKFARDGSQLVLARAGQESVEFWNLGPSPQMEHQVQTAGIATSLDWNDQLGQLAISVGREIWVWPSGDVDGEPIRLVGHRHRVVRLALNPNGKTVMSSSWDGTTRLFDLVTQREVIRIDGLSLTFDGFDDRGERIGYTSKHNDFGVWQLPSSRPIKSLVSDAKPGSRRTGIFVPGNSELLAYATFDGVEIWDHVRQKILTRVPSGQTSHICFGRDGSELYTSGPDGLDLWKLKIRVVESGERDIRQTVRWTHSRKIFDVKTVSVCFNAPMQRVAVETNDHIVQIFDLKTEHITKVGPHKGLSYLSFTPDGNFLVTLTWHGRGVKVWETKTGEFVKDLAPDVSNSGLSISAKNESLAVVSGDRRFEWSLVDWSEILSQRRAEPDGWQGGVAYSPCGKWMAITYSRYLLQIVDVRTKNTVAILEAPARIAVGGVDWSNDGKYLSVADQESIQVWDMDQIRSRLGDLKIDWSD